MFIETLFFTVKIWKQPKCPTTDEQLWYIHTMEYKTAIKRNKLLIQSTAWMKLKSIMLSGRS